MKGACGNIMKKKPLPAPFVIDYQEGADFSDFIVPNNIYQFFDE
jgi:hypothetical protein